MESWMVSLGISVMGVAVAWGAISTKIKRLEEDRKDDKDDLQRTVSSLSSKIEAVDGRMRDHTGNLYEAVDAIRNAGGVLEARVQGIEMSFQPAQIHEFNRQLGAREARLSVVEVNLRRVEDHLIEHIRDGNKN